MESNLVHGTLHATVFQATNLGHHRFPVIFEKAAEKIEDALHVGKGHSRLYATIDFGTSRVARTRVLQHEPTNPVWDENFHIYCAYSSPFVQISVKNELPVGAQVVGRTRILTGEILRREIVEGWFDLHDEEGNKLRKSQIRVRLQFVDARRDPYWNRGLRDRDFPGVQHTFFKQRTGCRVTLYQNSHLSEQFRPRIHLDRGGSEHGVLYQPQRLWEDMYRAIDGAKHFIYIAGWSVNTSITLVRDQERMIPGAEGVTLGELLKKKAEQGLRVLVLIWHDRTSVRLLGNEGLMKTHDEETFAYFQHTRVRCFLCPRDPDRSLSAVQHAEVGTDFTHHQKTVTLDAPLGFHESAEARKIVSYVGGIDLCDGRYDNEIHPLFRNLNTVYQHDFHQNNFAGADLRHGGPREPWHDAHSKVEGFAAWDVLQNFEQRWRKQADPNLLLPPVDEIRQITVSPPPAALNEDPEEAWNVQIFRSIDRPSVVGFPANPSEASELGLISVKDDVMEMSIQCAYIEAIRRAKRFIYIENQYFFGSCASWEGDRDCGCLHLIPIEIALKIVSKIRAGERFAVYVLTPMWPEGKPEGDTVQAILHWNRRTMDMMYKLIADALSEENMDGDSSPTDYLNFFCLGNRETKLPDEYVPPETPEQGTDYWNAQTHRRFLIYIHAKLMIVDDEYIIIGSANLNQRSMDGGRDTEIAQGSYQPHRINEDGRLARGQIHGYRMSLWYEHFASKNGGLHSVYLQPENVHCVRRIRSISERLWDLYVGEKIVDLPGHLLPFPVRVVKDGGVVDLDGEGSVFPDTTGPVKGRKSDILPPILTT